MKTLLTLAMLVTISASSFSQTMPAQQPNKNYYLTKSRHQKTLAWVMLGGGVALTGLGFGITSADVVSEGSGNNTAANVIAVVGIASAIGSIPVFISASHNKRKAAELSVNLQKIPVLNAADYTALFQPSFMLKFPINNR